MKKLPKKVLQILFLKIKGLLNEILRFLFPDFCIICSATENLSEDSICRNCRTEVLFLDDFPHCYSCGRKMKNTRLCIICEAAEPKFNDVKSVFLYNKHIAHFIKKIKFGDGTFLAKSAAEAIVKRFKTDIENCDFIIPIPIHRKRLTSRKYNQSALIALQIAKLIKVPVRFDILFKARNTIAQARLSMEKRKENLKNAFKIKNPAGIKNASIILLDDVITTGVTASMCAELLAQHNPKRILVVTLARSILQ